MRIFKGETYTDGYGVERRQLSEVEKAVNTVKKYFSNAKSNYKDLTETPGIGLLFPSNVGEAALMAAGPIVKIGKAAVKTEKAAKETTKLLDYMESVGMKVDGKLLMKPWFKKMADGSWTGQGNQLTHAARQAKATFVDAWKNWGMSKKEAGEMAASRFRYLLEGYNASEVFKQGGIIKRK